MTEDRPLWIRNPLAMLAEDEASGGLVIADGRIIELVPAGRKPVVAEVAVFDASEHVVLPGLINTHHHFYQTLTRACPPALDQPLFPWLEALYPIWAKLSPESFRLGVRLAMAELLLSGTTTTTDHHYVFPGGLEEAIDIEVEEADRLGLRVLMTRGSMSLSRDEGGLPSHEVVQREDVILADCERLIGKHHQTGEGAMVQIALAPCSPFSVTDELMRASVELAVRHDVRLHTHLAETEDEEAWCLDRFGCRPLDYLEDVGWLSDRVWLAHGIWFDEGEIHRLGKAGTAISHCPTSNMILASGCCQVPALEAAGAPVGIGVDGSASNDSSNLIEELRHAFLLQRLHHGAERISHHDALRWATTGSAACIGRADIGRIASGQQADLALFKLDELRFSGAGDPIAALILCGASRAGRVMVRGRWRVENGLIPGLDTDRLRAEHAAAARALTAG